ncbi:MAG: hypothetical protein HY234_06910 [Acidobacteria bacterium]|nr:hypothetical protein [Acidobacteriota bacterium]MBI3662763.1 hypothetical protein [Acidobacteriota bacterium]
MSRSDKELVRIAAGVADALQAPLAGVNVEKVGSSDSESFARRKIPSITFHSVTQETLPILHSPEDNIRAIHLDDYYQTYRLLTAYLTYLDDFLSRPKDERSKGKKEE